jgi:hypothetical protein
LAFYRHVLDRKSRLHGEHAARPPLALVALAQRNPLWVGPFVGNAELSAIARSLTGGHFHSCSFGPRSWAPPANNQLHFELVALVKPSTDVTTLLTLTLIAATCEAEGDEPTDEIAVSSDLSEDEMADVSLGKSLLAELTTSLAELSIFLSWDCNALTPPLERFALLRSVTDVLRSLTFEQYDGLLLPQEAKANATMAMGSAASGREATIIMPRPYGPRPPRTSSVRGAPCGEQGLDDRGTTIEGN